MRIPTNRAPTPPGEMLREEFLEPLGMTQKELAKRIGITRVRVNEIIKGRRGITPSTALRLAKVFGTSAQFWLNGQQAYDLYRTYQDERNDVEAIEPIRPSTEAGSSRARSRRR